MFDFLFKHPVFSVFSICLLLFLTAGMFFNAYINDYEATYFVLAIFLSLVAKKFIHKLSLVILALSCFALYLLLDSSHLFILVSEYILLISLLFFNKKQNGIFIFGIIAAAFLLHLFYIQKTLIDVRQHDLSGIILYMNHIIRYGVNWYLFNPWYMYYFFHQPLHFFINGYILEIEMFLWGSKLLANEGLQYISLFYTTSATIIAGGIFKELHFSFKKYYPALVLLAFNPTLTLFSGYISDDTPAFFWSMFIIYFLLLWYNEKKTSYLIFSALGFGFGVLTKLSVLMLVPAVTFLFVYELYYSDDKKKILQQLSYFIMFSIPIALIWVIRNHIFYDMPFYNVPDTSPAGQNFRYMDIWERITDFSMISSPFINAPNLNEPNIILALIKTELFGEWDLSLSRLIIYAPALGLYAMNIVLKIVAFIGVFIILKCNLPRIFAPLFVFFAIIYLTVWGYALKYSLEYPYICSSDFRLFSQLIIAEIVILTFFVDSLKRYTALYVFATLYAVLSCFIYIFSV